MTEQSAPTGRVVLAFAAVYLIWGSTYLAIRFAVETLPPFMMGGVRYGLAGVLLYGWLRARGAPRPTAKQWRTAAVAGGFLLLGGNGLVNWSEQFVSSGVTALIVGTVPIWFVTLAWLGPDREAPNGPEIGGIALGLAGVALLVSGSLEDIAIHGATTTQVSWGILALVVATVSWAIGSLYSRRAPMARPTLLATAMMMIAGGTALLLAGIALGEPRGFDPRAVSARSLAALAFLIVFGSIIAFSCYVWLFQVVRPALAGTYAYVNPIVAVLLGWALAGETITSGMAVGAALIVGAVVIAERGRARATRTPAPPGRARDAA